MRLALIAALLSGCGVEVPLGFHVDGTCGDAGVAGLGFDPAFGTCGTTVIDVAGLDNVGLGTQGLALDAQGRVLLAGTGGAALDTDMTVLRLLESGEVDRAFGNQGTAGITVTPGDHGSAVLVQPDGKVVIAGRLTTIGNEPVALVGRLLENGQVDTAFGTGGHVKGMLTIGVSGFFDGVLRRSDGVLLCSGVSYPTFPSASDAAVLGFTAAGVARPEFGATPGGTGLDWYARNELGGAAVFTRDGKLLVPATVGSPMGDDFGVARLDSNGVLDPAFTDSHALPGRVSVDFEGERDTVRAVFAGADGSVWAMGRATISGPTQVGVEVGALARWLPGGALDMTFGVGGRLLLRSWKTVSAVLPLDDGTFLLGGDAQTPAGDLAFAFQRIDTTGVEVGPLVKLDVSPADDSVRALVADGTRARVYAFGVARDGTGDNDFVVQRFIPEARRLGTAGDCSASAGAPLLVLALAAISTRKRQGPATKRA